MVYGRRPETREEKRSPSEVIDLNGQRRQANVEIAKIPKDIFEKGLPYADMVMVFAVKVSMDNGQAKLVIEEDVLCSRVSFVLK